MNRVNIAALALAVAGIASVAGCGFSDQAGAPEDIAPVGEPYPDEQVSLDLWLERLEVGSRELYSARAGVVDALHLSPGARVADIGAGTGVFSLLFAEQAGSDGVVYAIDIEPRFLMLINQRSEDLGLTNIVSILGRDNSITLPAGSVDVVFICDTYHYFDDPAAIMKTVFDALRPGGSLFIVDYDIAPGAAAPPDKRHIRAGKDGVAAEIESFGFGKAETIDAEGLAENYMLRFPRP